MRLGQRVLARPALRISTYTAMGEMGTTLPETETTVERGIMNDWVEELEKRTF